MKIWMSLICCTLLWSDAHAQKKTIQGIVFDKNSKNRVAKVNVLNITTGKTIYNTFKGDFEIEAKPGDVLIFTKPDHFADTVKIINSNSIAVYLVPTAIQLKEVIVRDTMLSPRNKLLATRKEFSILYGHLDDHDLMSIGPSGVGLSIDAIYNSLSRKGRNAERLRQTIQNDYEEYVIDYRFNKTYVASITGLKDPQLSQFMYRYRPGYFMVSNTNDYEFIESIKNNLKRFMRLQGRAYSQSLFNRPKFEDKD